MLAQQIGELVYIPYATPGIQHQVAACINLRMTDELQHSRERLKDEGPPHDIAGHKISAVANAHFVTDMLAVAQTKAPSLASIHEKYMVLQPCHQCLEMQVLCRHNP